jgi:hypothetical protein
MEIHISISKIRKYAVSASGDTVEVVERPNGGLSVVIADGQSSGKGAKTVSSMVVRKVIGLLAEGVRDGAAARAASDALCTERGGKVSHLKHYIDDQITQTGDYPQQSFTGSDCNERRDPHLMKRVDLLAPTAAPGHDQRDRS